MLKLQVLIASTRPSRQGPLVAAWFLECAGKHGKFDLELVDLASLELPLLDEPRHPRFRHYEHEHTRAWSAVVDRAEAFVFVTPEYDYSAPAALVNALQCLSQEWAYKPVGFTSYGGVSGGLRGVQMTKQLVTALKMMPMAEGVSFPYFTKLINAETRRFDPGEAAERAATVMLDELLKWADAMKPMRTAKPAT
jgi:NAD(P)H-dependent FMN reductase